MSSFDPILVPLDGSAAAARALGCAIWLADALGATLHVLSAGHPWLSAREELRRLRVPRKHWPRILLHQADAFPEQAVLDAVERYGVRLIVMAARGMGADRQEQEGDGTPVGQVTVSVIESSDVPVLVLPYAYRVRLPWKTALVPISGEPQADEALAVAVRLGNELDLALTVAHVVGVRADGAGLLAETRYADAAHHEYPARLDRLVERALAGSGRREARCIRDVVLGRGDVASTLLEAIEERKAGVIVIGWHARLLAGHAQVLRALLRGMSCPALLMRASPAPPFELKVGVKLV